MGMKGTVTGPAKYFISNHPFSDIRESEKRYSEVITRGMKSEGPTIFDKALRV